MGLIVENDARLRPGTAGLDTSDFIAVASDGTVGRGVAALGRGDLDALTDPVDRERLRSVLANVRRTRAQQHDVPRLRQQSHEFGCFGSLVGRSAPMQQVYRLIERVAPTDATVFITGESGTGKELVAEAVHRLSRRRSAPFIAVNCGAMAPALIESELFGHERGSFTGADRRRIGYFERADGGTLFLDEITEMPQDLQVKLLRVLEAGVVTRVGATEPTPINVRVLASSNRRPLDAVAEGRLREDLLYRLNVFPIDLPPLRQRGEDVALLARHFLSDVNSRDETQKEFSTEAIGHLSELRWPGNVRELKNAIERAAILADGLIDATGLPRATEDTPSTRSTTSTGPSERVSNMCAAGHQGATLSLPLGIPLADMERRMIVATLDSVSGSKRRAAKLLGISLKTLYNRVKLYEARPAFSPTGRGGS